MNTTDERGIIFSMDLLIAFLIMCMMMHLALASLSMAVGQASENVRDFSIERKGIYLIDSLVKNHDSNNSVLGSAYFDSGKKRVETGIIDYSMLKNARPEELDMGDGHYVQGLFIGYVGGRKEEIYTSERGRNCIVFERFVLLRKLLMEKAKICVVVCIA